MAKSVILMQQGSQDKRELEYVFTVLERESDVSMGGIVLTSKFLFAFVFCLFWWINATFYTVFAKSIGNEHHFNVYSGKAPGVGLHRLLKI